VPAARLADVLVPELDPAVLLGCDEHLLEQPAVPLLLRPPLVQRAAQVLDADGELVTEMFELR
jgi:hypothetical protein